MSFTNELSYAKELDARNALSYREQFIIPQYEGKDAIYFLGNSLGLQPKQTKHEIQQVLDTWSSLGVEGFFKGDNPWMDYHEGLAASLSKVVGALPQEMVVMNALTVNLHLMLISFYQPEGKRNKIICEAKAFPSDQYMLETHIRQRGLNPDEVIIEVGPREGAHNIDEADILNAIETHQDELALVFWGGVNYYTGQVFDLKSITEKAQAAGAKVGFDLAHGAGNIALQLHDWNVDFACWCNYKYLNSGPGAVAAAYVHERYIADDSLQRFAGWWGYQKETRFQMKKGFVPMTTAEGWGLSTPSPILYAAHKASLDLFDQAGMQNLAAKGKALSGYLLELLAELNKEFASPVITVLTPESEAQRGCQVSLLMLKEGKAIFNELEAAGVFADWREPDVIRVAPVPMYNTFEEVWQFVSSLKQACKKIIA